MSALEAIGLALALLGIAFAFDTPRRWFIRLLRLGPRQTAELHPTDSTSQVSKNLVASPPIPVAASAPPTPLAPRLAAASAPLVVSLQDGSKARVELMATLSVSAVLAPSFIAKHGTYEAGIATARQLVEAAAMAILEQQPSVAAIRGNRGRLERDIEVHGKGKLAAHSVYLETVALASINAA